MSQKSVQRRSTKIVATLGDVSADPKIVDTLSNAGVNVFRLNFSHGTRSEQGKRIDLIRDMEKRSGKPTCILADLQGPKFRVGLMNEGVVAQAIRRSVLDSIEDGLIVNSKWYACDSFEQVKDALTDVAGSNDERELTAHILLACYNAGFEEEVGLIINTRGETSARKTPSLEIIEGASCGDVLGVLWEDFGLQALGEIGINGDEAEEIWGRQNEKPKPFGKFLKSLDSAREKAKLSSLIPTKTGELPGACGHIVDLIRMGLLEGLGKAERLATSRHSSISEAAAAWAWLLAAERSSGQEWHFDGDARNKAGAWMNTTKLLLKTGEDLLTAEEGGINKLQQQWFDYLENLKQETGEA